MIRGFFLISFVLPCGVGFGKHGSRASTLKRLYYTGSFLRGENSRNRLVRTLRLARQPGLPQLGIF
jgi:hypothetical protein